MTVINKKCKKCGKTKSLKYFNIKKQDGIKRFHSFCRKCLYKYQIERWTKLKKKVILLMGGECSRCGYKKNDSVLCIHHLKQKRKDFDWNKLRLRSWKTILSEIKKCILVCANCHGEIHYPNLSDESNNK